MIKEHVRKKGINTKIISCKTVRDKNFIAYSSRLKKLKNYEKIDLVRIIKFLRNYKKNLIVRKLNHNFSQVRDKLLSLGAKKVEYIEILDLKTLKKPKKNKTKFNLFFSFRIGKVRFIDNF